MLYRIEQYFPIREEWKEIGCANSRCIALKCIFDIKSKHPYLKYRIVQVIDTY